MQEHLQRDRERDETAAVVSRGGGRTPDERAQELAWWSRVVVAGGATRLRWLVEARVEARVVVAGGSRGGRRLAWSPEFAEEKWQLRARGRRGSDFEP